MNWTTLNPLRWRKDFLLLLLGGFAVVWITFIDTYSIVTRLKLNRDKNDLIRKTEQLQLETKELEKKIQHLKSDPQVIEKIAREEFGMKKPKETVYRIKYE
jgi:cell division protein FtsB